MNDNFIFMVFMYAKYFLRRTSWRQSGYPLNCHDLYEIYYPPLNSSSTVDWLELLVDQSAYNLAYSKKYVDA